MADAKRPILEDLAFAARHLRSKGKVYAARRIEDARDLIQRQAAELEEKAADNARLKAEVERLKPKEMTLEQVARVLNVEKHSSFTRWAFEPFYIGTGEYIFRAENGNWTLREFEARAIAEKYIREQFAGPIAVPLEPDATAKGEEC